METKILRSHSLDHGVCLQDLEKQINEFQKEGWIADGGHQVCCAIAPGTKSPHFWGSQSMYLLDLRLEPDD